MLEPVRAAALLVAASHVVRARRALGDVAGHPFHGNQWTHGGGGELSSPSEAVHDILSGKRASVAEADVRRFLKKTLKQDAPVDLTKLQVEGHLIFGGNGLGIARTDMPQVPKDMRQQFLDEARERGITARREDVDPLSLHPSQKEISAQQVAVKLRKYEKDPDRAFPPILVSKDNYILDGHHHWGVMATVRLDHPGARIPVNRLSVGVRAALREMREFDERHDIKREAIKAALDWAFSALEFDEDEHPRDDAGKFTDKGGTSSPRTQALGSGRVKSSERVTGSINTVEKITLVDDKGHTVDAIFKPVAGETWTNGEIAQRQFVETYGVHPESELGQRIMAADYDDPEIQDLPAFDPDDYGDFEDDSPVRDTVSNRDFTYAEREAAAYDVDQALGLGVVPPTITREIDGKTGMVQEFIKADYRHNFNEVDPDSIYGAAVLDIVTGNTDRHSGNYLVANGKFVTIDQGLTFPDSSSEFRPDAIAQALSVIPSTKMSEGFAAQIVERLEKTDWEKLSERWPLSRGERTHFYQRINRLRLAFEEYEPSVGVRAVLKDLSAESTIASDW